MGRYFILLMLITILSCNKEESASCEINDLVATIGDCNEDGTYQITIDFNVVNPGNQSFDLFVRNDELIGIYQISDLPITIEDFEPSEFDYDYIKICINDNPECCETAEFERPDCSSDDCDITDLIVTKGECNSDGTYELTIDFNVNNSPNESFDLFVRNNVLIGNYNLSDLPLTINDFEPSEVDYDFIRICINDNSECCATAEFERPDCSSDDCDITDLIFTIGECNSDGTFELTIDFNVNNPGNQSFDLFVRNNVLIGYYQISDLPLTISHFEPSEADYDFIRICINDNPECCATEEFERPECLNEECEISDLVATIGDCNENGTYQLTIDFNVNNSPNESFDLFVRNNVSIGYFNLSELPLTISNFEPSGLDDDYIKVCINDNADCCSAIEFEPADCSSGECDITDLNITTGHCNSDGTYELTIDFDVSNQTNQSFDLYVRNNVLIGYYQISDLPLTISDFEPSGLDFDFIKVCINDNPECCAVEEFVPADCM